MTDPALRPSPRSDASFVASRPGSCATGGWALAALLVFAFALFMGSWRDVATMSGDPIVYSEIGREIVERGDPTRLTLDDRLVARKPPLVYWMQALSFEAFGFREWVARLPSCLMGVATIALLFLLVRRRHGVRPAFWAGVACLAVPVFQRTSHQARLDTTLTFFTLASIGAYVRLAERGPSFLRALGVGALLGLAVLAKGPAGLLGGAAIAVGSVGAGRAGFFARALVPILVGVLVVAAPWYALQVVREGDAWWSQLRADWTRDTAPVQGVLAAVVFYTTDVWLPAAPALVAFGFGTRLVARRAQRNRGRAMPELVHLSLLGTLLAAIPFLSMHYGRYFTQVAPSIGWVAGLAVAPWGRRMAHRSRVRRAERKLSVALLAITLVAYPIYVALDRPEPYGRYEDLALAAQELRRAAPEARTLPTWTESMEHGDSDAISRPLLSASRFYYETRLVPFDPADRSQPPLVLVLHGRGGVADAQRFESKHPGFVAVRRSEKATLYRTR